MAARMIGVEFGHDTLKLAVVSNGKVADMAVERMPDGLIRAGRVTSAPAMVEFIESMLSKHGIRKGACAMVIPSEAVIFNHITMPVMGDAEVKLNLPFEFRDFVGKEGSKYDYDYAVSEVKGNTMTMYAAAVRKEVIEEYTDVLKKAGLTLKIAMPAEMAWLNLVKANTTEPKEFCIVDIGASCTRVNIFKDGKYLMGKNIPISGDTLDAAIAEANSVDVRIAKLNKEADTDDVLSLPACTNAYTDLAIEIMRIINFFFSSIKNDTKLQDIYFAGGSANVINFRTAIVKRTDFTPHQINRFVPGDQPDEAALFCALSCGAALQQQ